MAESLTPFKQWLNFVDKQLSDEAVELLKLGLHSELMPFYSEVQNLKRPSELYYFLLKRCMKHSESRTLKIFLHALRCLGHGLRGCYVIKEAFGENSIYGITHPGPFYLKEESEDFRFFECLQKISTKARPALCDQLIKMFCKPKFLKINRCQVKSLSQLFIELFQANLIAANKTDHLVDVLKRLKAWTCLNILNDYHKSVGLPPIPLPPGTEYGKAYNVFHLEKLTCS